MTRCCGWSIPPCFLSEGIFRLFFSAKAKGCKLQFGTSPVTPSVLEATDHFESYLGDVFQAELVDWQCTYTDLAFDICPSTGHLHTKRLHVDEEPQVLSWKRCCQEKIVQQLYDDQLPAKHGCRQRYCTQNMLYDVTTVITLPSEV